MAIFKSSIYFRLFETGMIWILSRSVSKSNFFQTSTTKFIPSLSTLPTRPILPTLPTLPTFQIWSKTPATGRVQPWTKELIRHQSLNVVFTGHFVWGGEANLAGQKQSVKFLQNMLYSTISPQTHTVCIYCTCTVVHLVCEGGGRSERR
jgi:hypothetical protein